MKLIIINGPNLNLLGLREPDIYGENNFDFYFDYLKEKYKNIDFEYFQSNIEGELIDKIQEVGFSYDAIILNPGGYTHTSVSIADAIAAIKTPVIEVHISNIFKRENFRQNLITTNYCKGAIFGFGLDSYELAVKSLLLSWKK
ncbi:MAG: 3-dehydroquinate dehydratase [Bacteroidales bacterium]|jgi:3-dehydroquinate dehydratase-2|nr:3-dehydroquinate dehydratase [Bacteroidales bacterium]